MARNRLVCPDPSCSWWVSTVLTDGQCALLLAAHQTDAHVKSPTISGSALAISSSGIGPDGKPRYRETFSAGSREEVDAKIIARAAELVGRRGRS